MPTAAVCWCGSGCLFLHPFNVRLLIRIESNGGRRDYDSRDMVGSRRRDGPGPVQAAGRRRPGHFRDGNQSRGSSDCRLYAAAVRRCSEAYRQARESALLRYCELDTLVMVMVVQAWQDWSRSSAQAEDQALSLSTSSRVNFPPAQP